MKYVIVGDNITVGRFTERKDRDDAFNEYFIKTNRFVIKREMK